ncbi:AraC family transcriptional regulator [Pseudoalteromonas ruthenica]|uniref:AraC family transcriptional regulator n=1 Tax=Pseudoalteromonas ruthenica TaxID=151081 RepID=A0A5S3Z3L2_9GAMM|nr:AraC family transcriptional regulator [Pseudoalteromonas ruthenica]MCG7566101.1 AraC family transcriptional regulator [Pseudoalteromonas sp. CnMc7-15]TMP86812.1 AraC family transcriptional regulator [Pseudoalteromonas ruthenica]
MRAMCEKVIPSPNCSWRYCLYRLPEIPFNWHYHPEYEICLTLNSRGVCHIGDYIAPYGDYDLVLLGPELPHTWQSKINTDLSEQIVHVAQIPAPWLESMVAQHPELQQLEELLSGARRGLRFSQQLAKQCQALFENMEQASPLQRYVLLMDMLTRMAQSQYDYLSSAGFRFDYRQDPAKDKFDRVISFIYDNYTEKLSADMLAEHAHMSTNHFHRFFKKRTERTVTEFINQLRIAKACKLLINTSSPITVISDQCGFNNISNFNRRFQTIKNCTPSQFRARLQQRALI